MLNTLKKLVSDHLLGNPQSEKETQKAGRAKARTISQTAAHFRKRALASSSFELVEQKKNFMNPSAKADHKLDPQMLAVLKGVIESK